MLNIRSLLFLHVDTNLKIKMLYWSHVTADLMLLAVDLTNYSIEFYNIAIMDVTILQSVQNCQAMETF